MKYSIGYSGGDEFYTTNGVPHMEDGHAIKRKNGTLEWYYYGKRHREDGPAIEWADGTKYWYYHGRYIDCKDNKEFLRMIKLMVFL